MDLPPLRILIAEPTRVVAMDLRDEIMEHCPTADIVLVHDTHARLPEGGADLVIWGLGRATEELRDLFDAARARAMRTVYLILDGRRSDEDLPVGVWKMHSPFDASDVIDHVDACLSSERAERPARI
ncbi:hypothetical protein [Histidinibacterium aquaticum]|uniref:Response regulatory domain-containing protein n=1 Tax=Histidinibacterium aquaticum TaxID=2613962 RepID=A0A5J5GIB6_9RHOB|nr:hypothetical protein [Histidinibacterium aquaticum]KAA9007951.1 hypothetical protein F3S47_10565 [Histidinibacterium aquaticum]